MIDHKKKSLGIYIHIPFCVRKCYYCDFLSAPAGRETQKKYLGQLKSEILSFQGADGYEVRSVFFGGGTPSILEAGALSQLMETLRSVFPDWREDAECTVECNPGTLTMEKLIGYRESGINRLSIGLQSANNRELELLGRIHTWEEFLESWELAREAGFDNLNVDLMSGLPGQKRSCWKQTLESVLQLSPEHISAYSLIIEEGTEFYQRYQEDLTARERGQECRLLPSEEEERGMYYDTEEILRQYGYHRYEISNYARPGYESRHNSGYWERIEYIGFGLGSSSQIDHTRWKNTDRLEEYLEGDRTRYEVEELTVEDEMEETMFLGLRMMKGVDLRRFEQLFGITVQEVYPEVVGKLTAQGLITIESERLKLTPAGIDVSNYVMGEFLL